ncbi:MAG: cytochrome P460 family protein [Acidobacteriota bacterium]|nr:cytochrome P460 family protein [Acidobacteriota bacterium]
MSRTISFALAALLLPARPASPPQPPADAPAYTAAGAMVLPAGYREWVFLSSGLDISYNAPTSGETGHSVFQNVFVNPTAYRAFLQTGTWADKTTLVLEIRGAAPKAGIDRRGQTQTAVRAIEVHVKDSSRIPTGDHWAFYEFGAAATAKIVDRPASCYTCHESHAAVDTTFVQYYPTLIDLARDRHTLSPAFLKDSAHPATP